MVFKQFFICILLIIPSFIAQSPCTPNGIRLTLGDSFDKTANEEEIDNINDYIITYFTENHCNDNYIEVFATQEFKNGKKIFPLITEFSSMYGETEATKVEFKMFIYEFKFLSSKLSLIPGEYAYYSCSYKKEGILQEKGKYKFYHHDYNQLKQKPFSFAWIADYDINKSTDANSIGRQFGLDNMKIIKDYINNDRRKEFIGIVTGGDYAYNLEDDQGQRGVEFLKAGEFMYAEIPYMTIAGNHEWLDNYAYFKAFFRNPNYSQSKNEYYTISVGDLLLVGLNNNKFSGGLSNLNEPLEPYYSDLLEWLEQALSSQKPFHRWIIVFAHQNIYCYDDLPFGPCYSNPAKFKRLEAILLKYGVDIYLNGHIHAYERVHPHLNGKLGFEQNEYCKMSSCDYYQSPKAPVYVSDGTGGTTHYFPKGAGYPVKGFSVKSDRTLGFSTVTIQNSTHLKFQHFLSDNLTLFDSFTIHKPLIPIDQSNQDKNTEKEDPHRDQVEHHEWIMIMSVALILIGIVILYILYSKYKARQVFDQNNGINFLPFQNIDPSVSKSLQNSE